MKTKLIIIFIILIIGNLSIGQTVLMHEKISDYDFDVPKRGPNFRHFTHLFVGFAFYIPIQNENQIDCVYGASTSFSVGYRYKYKITNFVAIGAGLHYTNDIFTITQNENKIFPNKQLHKRERMRFNSLGAGAFIRFNIGKRGNIIGRFVDLGGYYDWIFVAKHVFKNRIEKTNPNYAGHGKEKVVLSALNYVRNFHYGFRGRLGINRFVLTASYRLDDLLNCKYAPLFLPRLNVGLEIGLHK